jgi:hypothetical protein
MKRRVWNEVEQLLQSKKKFKDRALSALVDAAFGHRFTRFHYVNSAEVSGQAANVELNVLVDHGLLAREGQTRGRIYCAPDKLLKFIFAVTD